METIHSRNVGSKSNITSRAWPHRCLTQVALRDARRLALDVRGAVQGHDPHAPLVDLRDICRVGGFRVIERELSGDVGGIEAALLPRARNHFHIWVDPTPYGGWDKIQPGMRPAVHRHRVRFRVAHEIAHSFFFRRDGGLPRRVLLDSPEQEDFADVFASALLIPPDVARATQPTAESILALHDQYDVSLQVAVRAVVEAQQGVSAVLVYWPGGAAASIDKVELQWCTEDRSRDWCDAIKAIGTSHDQGALLMPSRQQLLWVNYPPSARVSPARF